MTQVSAQTFTSESNDTDDKCEIKLIVYMDHENGSSIEIAFYRVDGENCLAVVDGKTVATIKRSAVIDLIEAVNGIVLG